MKIDTGFLFPNGIAILHGGDDCPKTLIVAETPTRCLWGYDIVGNGKVENKRIWGQLPGTDIKAAIQNTAEYCYPSG